MDGSFLARGLNYTRAQTISLRKAFALSSEEPFRVFFPLGLILGVAGVTLWPLYVWQIIHYYPSTTHVRLMIEGFMGSFIVGFLGTAGPRLLEAKPFRAPEISTLIVLQFSSGLLHLARRQTAGDFLFEGVLLVFLGLILTRIRSRVEEVLPPPSFILVLFGYGCAILGVALILTAPIMSNGVVANQLGSLLLNEGFVLLPILGVGAFFLPKLLGGARPAAADLEISAVEWKRKAFTAAGAGLLIIGSFVLETMDWTRTAAFLRGTTTLLFFATQGRLFKKPVGPPFLAHCFRLGLILLVIGLFLPVMLSAYRLANLHVVFLGGFCVILFTVSTRVIVGHSGQGHLFQRRMPFLITTLFLLLLAMTARVAAEFSAVERSSHLVYAALIWIAAAFAWAWALVAKLLVTDDSR
jgi:uncharacterized protein involved in response to NO